MDLLDEAVSKDDVTQLFQKLVKTINDLKKTTEEKSTNNLEEMKRIIAEFEPRLTDTEARVTKEATTAKTTSQSEARTVIRLLNYEIERLESMIENYDDAELRAEIASVRAAIPKIPPQFDPTSILAELSANKTTLEDHERRIVELEQRPVARGGGTSAIGVAQAFKYIAHTEQPVGAIDGINTTYRVKNVIYWVAGFMLNGEQIAEIPNFTYVNRTITFATPLPAAYNGKDFEMKYIGH